MVVPRLTRRLGNARLLATALALTLIGLACVSRASAESHYLTGVAHPMILVGTGRHAALGPLTVTGVVGGPPQDAGAASGIVIVAHQLGASLGLAVLVVVFAAASSG